MLVIGFKSGREIVVESELVSLKVNELTGKIASANWNHKSSEKLKWFDIDSVDYIIERED